MRRMIIIKIIFIVTVSITYAYAIEPAYIGLYTESEAPPNPYNSCVLGEGIYLFEMYIWCLPSSTVDLKCIAFAVSYPDNIIPIMETYNEGILSRWIGNLSDGIDICYTDCQGSWNWPVHQTLYVVNSNPTWIEVMSYPEWECPIWTDCHNPIAHGCFVVHTKFGINQQCPPAIPIGTESVSWSKIKYLLK